MQVASKVWAVGGLVAALLSSAGCVEHDACITNGQDPLDVGVIYNIEPLVITMKLSCGPADARHTIDEYIFHIALGPGGTAEISTNGSLLSEEPGVVNRFFVTFDGRNASSPSTTAPTDDNASFRVDFLGWGAGKSEVNLPRVVVSWEPGARGPEQLPAGLYGIKLELKADGSSSHWGVFAYE